MHLLMSSIMTMLWKTHHWKTRLQYYSLASLFWLFPSHRHHSKPKRGEWRSSATAILLKDIIQTAIPTTLAMKSGCFSVRLMRYDASAAENFAKSDRRKVCKQFARIFSVMTFQWQASWFMLNFWLHQIECNAHNFNHFSQSLPS